MDLQVKDKVFMIAGASRGLAFNIAKVLAEEGASLSIASSNAENIEKAAKELREEYGVAVFSSVCDVSSEWAVSRWFKQTLTEFGGIDGLVVNAGGPPPGDFDAFSDDDWYKAFDLNLMSAVRMIRSALPSMRERGGGSILTMTSSSVKEPIDYLLLSNVMRSAVTSLAKSLSRQLASENIRVNNLVPGIIGTERITNLATAQAEMNSISLDQQYDNMTSEIPMGRFGDPIEFGRAGAFLLSPMASYITGSTLVVDGGTMKTVW